MLHQVVYST